jgi:hypothetical protein
VCAGYEERWDGRNRVGSYSTDAEDAVIDIVRACEAADYDTSLVRVWQAADWYAADTTAEVCARLGVTADTTDDQLIEIALAEEAAAVSADVDAVERVLEYLHDCRDELRS